MWPYFSSQLLDQVRVVELHGQRVPPPAFYPQARALGFDNLPQVTHMDSLTFLDVLVFNQMPVSYTHLDVYKRQIVVRIHLKNTLLNQEATPQEGPEYSLFIHRYVYVCLLYTSRCV